MNAEEELKVLKQLTQRRGRITAITFGIIAMISLLFMIYGFTQNIEAGRQRDLGIEKQQKLNECMTQLNEMNERALTAEKEAMKLKTQLEQAVAYAKSSKLQAEDQYKAKPKK